MSAEININKETLRLEGGYLDVLKDAIRYNSVIHKEDIGIINRNRILSEELKYVKSNEKLLVYKSNLPKYIYLLIENFAAIITENDRLRKIHEEEGRKI